MHADARLTLFTRLGFAARGLLYIIIAVLLLRTGRAEDPEGALDYLADGGGRIMLFLIAAGFIAYGIWRMSDALFNIEGHESSGKGMRQRLGAAGSGIVHLLLAWQAIRLIRGAASAGGGGSQGGVETALALPGGQLLLILAGALLIGVGIFQLVKAAKAEFLRHLEPRIARQDWAKWTGRIGYAARGLVFAISGYFLLQAGLDDRASKAGGIEEALEWLSDPWNMVVGLGLLAFGLYSLIEARFRILHDVPVEEMAHRAAHPGQR